MTAQSPEMAAAVERVARFIDYEFNRELWVKYGDGYREDKRYMADFNAVLAAALRLAAAEGAVEGHIESCPGPVSCTKMHERVDERDAARAAIGEQR